MTASYKLDITKAMKLTEKELEELKAAKSKPIVPDEDCPVYSEKELKEMLKISEERRIAQQRELISLRVDHESIAMAKQFGKGYTNLFSKLIYIGMRDPEILKRAL